MKVFAIVSLFVVLVALAFLVGAFLYKIYRRKQKHDR